MPSFKSVFVLRKTKNKIGEQRSNEAVYLHFSLSKVMDPLLPLVIGK